MPENWTKYELGKIAQVIGGGTPSTKETEYWNGKIPWLTPKDLTNFNFRYIITGERSISKEGLANSSARLLPKNTILLTSRAPIGYLAIAANEVCTNQGFKSFVIDEEKVDPLFFYYLLKNNVEFLKSLGTGSTFAEVSASVLKGVELVFPPLEQQRQIASILSSLDEKIELNLQMNEMLEEIAQTIFYERFGKYKPGGELPEGWKWVSISDIAENIQYGFTMSSTKEAVGPKFLRITDIQGGRINWKEVPYCKIDEKDFEKYKIKEHDIFIARTGASTGENVHVIDPPDAVFASYLIRVQFSSTHLATYIGKYLRRLEYISYISSVSGGSAQPNANAKQLTGVNVILPKETDLLDYFEIVDDYNKRIRSNQKEIEYLSEIRDSLLPRLMSGRIEVKMN